VQAGLYVEAFDTWRAGLPASAVFGTRNAWSERAESLRRAVHNAARPQATPEDLFGLADSFSRLGRLEEARAVHAAARRLRRQRLDRIGTPFGEEQLAPSGSAGSESGSAASPRAMQRVELVESVERAIRDLGTPFTIEDAAQAITEAARATGLRTTDLPTIAGEAGTLATPDHTICTALKEAGVLLDLRTERGLPVARTLAAAAELEARVPAGHSVRAYLAEPRSHAPTARTGLLGRTTVSAASFFIDVSEVRPRNVWLASLDAARAPLALGPDGDAPPSDPLFALRRRAALALLPPGLPRDQLFERALSARVDYVVEHETGHVRDLRELWPLSEHPVANLERVVEGGLNPRRIAARYEELAELHALSELPDASMALLSLAEVCAAHTDLRSPQPTPEEGADHTVLAAASALRHALEGETDTATLPWPARLARLPRDAIVARTRAALTAGR
jgi:hypothetical protein